MNATAHAPSVHAPARPNRRRQYSLYPQALVPAMIEEVGAALSWALDSAAAYGGDPKQVRAGGGGWQRRCSLLLVWGASKC